MKIFELHEEVLEDYKKYVQSFVSVADDQILKFIREQVFSSNYLWPDVLIQLNPTYQMGETVKELSDRGAVHPIISEIFHDKNNLPFRLYQHQQAAIEKAKNWEHFVVTSGTGSGKSLCYFIPIMNFIAHQHIASDRVAAIIVYPMNALVNSQFESLKRLSQNYFKRTGNEFPLRFEKYTGQEGKETKDRIQKNPPHILLTNYVMLELMLVRPQERNFVDKTTSALQFLVFDELHTYRGRQGADVGLLIRRLRERCGNPALLCIGTSATMVSNREGSPQERRKAVADYASQLFGVKIESNNIIEESLSKVTNSTFTFFRDELIEAIRKPIPTHLPDFLNNPFSAWLETTFGIEQEIDERYRRRIPITLAEGAKQFHELTGIDQEEIEEKIRQYFYAGSRLRLPDNNPVFALKLHQFISQGQTLYATMESREDRYLTQEAQYYAPGESQKRILYPLKFCRLCGQEYYLVKLDTLNNKILPEDGIVVDSEGEVFSGYIYFESKNGEEWSNDYLPDDWFDEKGRVIKSYQKHIPQPIWVSVTGDFESKEGAGMTKAWFQPRPFLICLKCGEYYTKQNTDDFRKLTGLSNEGRSSATTVLTTSILRRLNGHNIDIGAKKILSFTDNRQDASLQSGHFNDFVQVSLIRAAIYQALAHHESLSFYDIAEKVVNELGLSIADYSSIPNLLPDTLQGKEVKDTFRDLVEYRIYEDLRRGWRILQPNLEQCGLLHIEYRGLEELCNNEKIWEEFPQMKKLSGRDRLKYLTAFLDFTRKKLAIDIQCLKEIHLQQLRKKAYQNLNEKWAFDQSEYLHTSSYLVYPNLPQRSSSNYISLSSRSLLYRFLKRYTLIDEDYDQFIQKLIRLLSGHGIFKIEEEKGQFRIQLNAGILIWKKGDGRLPRDLIYSRKLTDLPFRECVREANSFFREFYSGQALSLRQVEGREHTAQVSYENRKKREDLFREGKLQCLFCSPTMELGIDISDLQLVHLRNIPPTPANYAQRSGRAGRTGDPALVMSYCQAGSAHDQYYFHKRTEMVSGTVRPPRIDLENQDMVIAHLHSIWLARTGVDLKDSIDDILEIRLSDYPLKESILGAIQLNEKKIKKCIQEARWVLSTCILSREAEQVFTDEWVSNIIMNAPKNFDQAFNRFRELYRTADQQWVNANEILRFQRRDRAKIEEAQRLVKEAERQIDFLLNQRTSREESDFYPYRYLASEGFLPGYNFPRLPVRAFIDRGEGEYISRPRFLAVSEFGPHNLIYHEGSRFKVDKLFLPPHKTLESRKKRVLLCRICGYFNDIEEIDCCLSCGNPLDGNSSEQVPLLEMSNVRARKGDRITCDDEERIRYGYHITTHYQFAPPAPTGKSRIQVADIYSSNKSSLFTLTYAPSATLYRINRGWRKSKQPGFLIDLESGEWRRDEAQPNHRSDGSKLDVVNPYVWDTSNILLISCQNESIPWNEEFQASFQYALQRGMEEVFQIEESEIASERIGSGKNRSLLFWEASEGGAGVLRRLVEERDCMAEIARSARSRIHFDENKKDLKPTCVQACYECLLSYSNQRDYAILNRHLVVDILAELSNGMTLSRSDSRSYGQHYQYLRSLTDSRSDLERHFLDFLYHTKRRLPDDAQKRIVEYNTIPDFFYEPNICVFCDGSVHNNPDQQKLDQEIRNTLRDYGYRIIVIRYDRDLSQQIEQNQDIFEGGE
jgi:superfamily II DNA/RNA helicase